MKPGFVKRNSSSRRNMRSLLLSFCLAALLGASATAQLLSPLELKEPRQQKLQQQYWSDLTLVADALDAHRFPFPFYFSRTLDIDLDQQRRLPQGSIRFERHDGQTVLAITGNYYASYSSELMNSQQRVKQAMVDVLLPLLKAAVPPFAQNDHFSAFALEISYHVRRKVLGVQTESPENVVLILPVAAARKVVASTNADEMQSAILDGEMYLDGEPFALWLSGDTAPLPPDREPVRASRRKEVVEVAKLEPEIAPEPPLPTVSGKLIELPKQPVHMITGRDLAMLQSAYEPALERLRLELEPQAHFIAYAPPSFVEFLKSAELQLSVETSLPARGGESQYKLAALAFDEHVAHLVRPVLTYLATGPEFDGVDFSSTVRTGSAKPISVEFILPLKAMRCFAAYECTGQQLINVGIVLINGERAGLQLDAAEGAH